MSAKQLFWDGSHKVCEPRPVKVEIQESGKKAFCQCKRAKPAPFCEGATAGCDPSFGS
jgi:CDGSH-type Zn-finger protein